MTTYPGISWKLVSLSQAQYNTKVADCQESKLGGPLSPASHYDFDNGCKRAADVTSLGNGPFVGKPSFYSRDTQKAHYLGHFRYSCWSLLNICQNDEPLAEANEDTIVQNVCYMLTLFTHSLERDILEQWLDSPGMDVPYELTLLCRTVSCVIKKASSFRSLFLRRQIHHLVFAFSGGVQSIFPELRNLNAYSDPSVARCQALNLHQISQAVEKASGEQLSGSIVAAHCEVSSSSIEQETSSPPENELEDTPRRAEDTPTSYVPTTISIDAEGVQAAPSHETVSKISTFPGAPIPACLTTTVASDISETNLRTEAGPTTPTPAEYKLTSPASLSDTEAANLVASILSLSSYLTDGSPGSGPNRRKADESLEHGIGSGRKRARFSSTRRASLSSRASPPNSRLGRRVVSAAARINVKSLQKINASSKENANPSASSTSISSV